MRSVLEICTCALRNITPRRATGGAEESARAYGTLAIDLHLCFSLLMIECVIHISLWSTIVEDIEETLGYVHITWDTNGEEVTHKEKKLSTEKVTKDYYKLETQVEDIPKNDIITLKVKWNLVWKC